MKRTLYALSILLLISMSQAQETTVKPNLIINGTAQINQRVLCNGSSTFNSNDYNFCLGNISTMVQQWLLHSLQLSVVSPCPQLPLTKARAMRCSSPWTRIPRLLGKGSKPTTLLVCHKYSYHSIVTVKTSMNCILISFWNWYLYPIAPGRGRWAY